MDTSADAATVFSVMTMVRIAIILVAAFVLYASGRALSKRLEKSLNEKRPSEETRKRARTLDQLLRYVLAVIVVVVAGVMILGHLGVRIGPILGAAGIIGIAVGFGAQRLVQDVISGFFILADDQIRVGDVVDIAGKAGVVERVDLRMTVLRDLQGDVHFIRHGQVDVVTNKTKGFSFAVFDVGVAYKENVDDVIAAMRTVADELRADESYAECILEPLDVLGLDRFEDSAVVVRARIKTRPGEKWAIAREYNRRLKAHFDAVGIEIPFPHLTLFMGREKPGGSSRVATSESSGRAAGASEAGSDGPGPA